jgi:hypothetical protein
MGKDSMSPPEDLDRLSHAELKGITHGSKVCPLRNSQNEFR